ncbi:UNVERIFIED_CONTAM: diguanylate cyclase (GGDEF)-like protein [Acetivibrio alkalicellulosi]
MSEIAYASICMVAALFERSKKYFTKALNHAIEIDDQLCIGLTYQYMGHYYNWIGNSIMGISYAEKSADIFRRIGEIREFALSLNPLVQGYYYQGDYDNMFIINRELHEIAYKIKDNYTLCASNIFFIQYYREKGEYKEAERYGKEVNKYSLEIKDWFNFCSSCIELGILYLDINDISKAIEYFEKAKELKDKNNFISQYVVLLYHNLADAYILDFIKNERNMNRSTQLSYIKKIKYTCKQALKYTKHWALHYGGALRVNACYKLLKGEIKNSEKLYLKCINHCNKYNRKFEAARGYYEYGLLLKLLRRVDEAKSCFEIAYDIFNKIGAISYKNKVGEHLDKSYHNINLINGASQEIRNYQRMLSIISLIKNISSILDMNILLDKILMTAIEVSGAQNGYLMLKNEKTGILETVVKKITSGSVNDYSEEIIQKVYEKGEAVVDTNAAEEERNSMYRRVLINKTKSVLCLPIKSNDQIVGICYLENKLSSSVFDQEDMDILNSILGQAAISIENAKLFKMATTDGLTGLVSHKHFKFILDKEIERCKRYEKVFSLIMFDIDHFKTINDKYGHQAGDLILVNVAQILKEFFRSADTIARYGGDEIAIILPETDEAGALTTAQKLIDSIRSQKVLYEEKEILITISVGIASYPQHASSSSEVIRASDFALYKSKESGRDRVSIYS